MRRVLLFLGLNFLIITVLMVLSSVLGIEQYVGKRGYFGLFVFCLFWGMGGAFISLQLSRWMAKRAMGVQLIDGNSYHESEQWLVRTVHRLSEKAGLPKMPEVGVYDSPEVNAFATGPSKSRSLVAVSSGLMRNMKRDEVEGVLAHEVAHIANGDMVTMALLTGVVNAFVMFFARIIAMAIDNAMRGRGGRGGLGGIGYFIVVMVLQTVLMIPGSILIAKFSRWREFRADKGGADLAGTDKMRRALESLQRTFGMEDPRLARAGKDLANMKISGGKRSGLRALMASHPPLSERISRLQ